MLRELCATLDAADVWLGKSLSTFFRGRQWERLGYASDGQYARERLGMSRSSAWERVMLARSTTRLDRIVEAIHEGAIGTCAARMLVRIVTPDTEHEWVERAKVRTFKHLREEIELVSMDVRLLGDDANRFPPDDDRIRRYHEWQREVLTGEMFRKSAETGEPVRMSARSPDAEAETTHMGLVDMQFRSRADVIDFYQVLEDAFNSSGIDDTFECWLAKSFTDTWGPTLGKSDCWEHVYSRDLYRCTCPVCLKKDCTAHHVVYQSHGGGDEAENLTSPCADDHLFGIHLGTLRVTGEAPYDLTWTIGRNAVMTVRGRERELIEPRARA
jgi:5-methylcytosine-specific restriction endonuclease McrA